MWVLAVVGALCAGVAIGIWIGRLQPPRRPVAEEPVPEAVFDEHLAGLVIEQLSSGVLIVDRSEKVLLSNFAARTLGTVTDSRLGSGSLQQVVAHALATGERVREEVDLPARPGRESRCVALTALPLGPGTNGRPAAVAMLIDDVTDSRRLDAVRRDFVANVSHELKTPVGALTLLAEALQDAADDPDVVRKFARRMRKESTRLGRLVNELIALSRLEGADRMPVAVQVPLTRIIDEAVSNTAAAAEDAGITVLSSGAADLTVAGSESQLVSALENLMENAIRYSPSGTRVAVTARAAGTPAEPVVQIAVTDQGIGIAEADLPRVFERFFRADEARSRATGGTGLGLAIVKHTMANHGGSVSAWSVPGAGSTFTLTMPLVPAAPEPVADPPDPVLLKGAR